MSKMKLDELRQIVREVIINRLLEFVTSDMPNGSSWKVANKGWAAKNANGVTNYWYGKDEVKNKESAAAWAKDNSKKKNDNSTSTTKTTVGV